jgi:hypothetical protein
MYIIWNIEYNINIKLVAFLSVTDFFASISIFFCYVFFIIFMKCLFFFYNDLEKKNKIIKYFYNNFLCKKYMNI